MIIPPYLKPGDYVGIISTARSITQNELKRPIEILQSWGLKIKLGKNLFLRHNQFSATDNQRASDLETMLKEKYNKAIFCARRGYGTIRIIDKIRKIVFRDNLKWSIGYSDVTVLHSY